MCLFLTLPFAASLCALGILFSSHGFQGRADRVHFESIFDFITANIARIYEIELFSLSVSLIERDGSQKGKRSVCTNALYMAILLMMTGFLTFHGGKNLSRIYQGYKKP